MIRLDRILDHLESLIGCRRESLLHQRVSFLLPQAPQPLAQIHRHEHRKTLGKLLASRMRNTGARARGLATRSAPLATPVHESESDLTSSFPHAQQRTCARRIGSHESQIPARFRELLIRRGLSADALGDRRPCYNAHLPVNSLAEPR
jgi:hypothetical protein